MCVSRMVGWFLGVLLSVGVTGQAVAAEDWLVRTTRGNTQHVLFKDGSVTKVEPQRGDPKESYSKSGNRCHSEKQRAKSAECESGEDKVALDLSDWQIAAQGGSDHTNYFVNFRNRTDSGLEVVLVYYDLKAGGVPTSAVKRTYSSVDGSVVEESLSLDDISVLSYYDLPLSTCSTVHCSGFDENGNLQYTATISYDGVLLGRD